MAKYKENNGRGKAKLMRVVDDPWYTHLIRFEDGSLKWATAKEYEGLVLAPVDTVAAEG